ncbi:MAG: YabP/YqfC family sporulation protein [Clostridia bacterium]|nr:YabP/YqfC family sporulation protein [Clostridia bacterium]
MKRKRRMHKAVLDAFGIPEDLDPRLVKITWLGRTVIAVEQHRGILGFEPEEIRLASEQGDVVIRGKGMQMSELTETRAYLEGEFDGIFFGE